MQAQKESIPDRASVHAKKDDFSTKKPRKKQSCDAPTSKQESHIPDRCSRGGSRIFLQEGVHH